MLDGCARLKWARVPERAADLTAKCRKIAEIVQARLPLLSQRGFLDVWVQPHEHLRQSGNLLVNLTKEADVASWRSAFTDTAYSNEIRCFERLADHRIPAAANGGEPWVKVAMRPYIVVAVAEKRAYDTNLRRLMSVTGWNPDLVRFPGWPSPAAAMLATGMLGAGAGYGAGWLAEKVLPEKWERGKLRRSLALLGGLGGTAMATPWMATNAAHDRSVFSGWPYDTPPFQRTPGGVEEMPASVMPKLVSASYGDPDEDTIELPIIPVDDFNDTVLRDPRVAPLLSPQTQAAAAGLILGAAHLAGGLRPATLISPWDVARMTAGMGTGYLSGVVVGKVLGALMGMPGETQDMLKRTGMFAGAITNIIPMAFGGKD